MTFIPGASTTNNLSTSVSTSVIPAGGKLVTVVNSSTPVSAAISETSSETYVVPEGSIFVATQAGFQTTAGGTFSQYYGTITCQGNQIATVANSGVSPSTSIYLSFSAGQIITVGAANTQLQNCYISGYEIAVTKTISANEGVALNTPYSGDWASGVLLTATTSSQTPVRAVWLGDGKALLIRNAVINKDTTVIDIETGVETAIYTGTASFSVADKFYLQAAYSASYKSTGKSLTRIATGEALSTTSALQFGDAGTTGFLLDIYNGDTDADFTVRSLKNVTYNAISDGRFVQTTTSEKIVGFAGIDYLATVRAGNRYYANTTSTELYDYSVKTYKVDATATVVAEVVSSANLFTNSMPTVASGVGDIAATGTRGNNGRLYISLNSLYFHTGTTPYGRVAVVVLDSTGAAVGNFTTGTGTIYSYTNTLGTTYRSFTFPASLGLTAQANGSERALMWLHSSSTQGVQLHFSFTSAGVPSSASLAPTSFAAASFSAPSAPAATTLASYNTSLGYVASSTYYGYSNLTNSPSGPTGYDQLFHHPTRARLTNGCFFGNVNGWYIPNGLFVEKRSRTDIMTLVGTGVVDTTIQNPVQAYASTTKLLIVGANGEWEIVTP